MFFFQKVSNTGTGANGIDNRPPNHTAADQEMANETGAHWTSFIKTGSPADPWDPYGEKEPYKGRYILKAGVDGEYEDDSECNCKFWTDNF